MRLHWPDRFGSVLLLPKRYSEPPQPAMHNSEISATQESVFRINFFVFLCLLRSVPRPLLDLGCEQDVPGLALGDDYSAKRSRTLRAEAAPFRKEKRKTLLRSLRNS
jgi:hypothetical protein